MNQEKGQSLIEVILALAVALLVIVALVRLTVTSIRNAQFAKNKARATQYAQESMEEARRLRDEEGGAFFVDGYCDVSDEDLGLFTRNRDCNLNGNVMEITVTVEWSESGESREVELKTNLTSWR